MLRKAWLAVIAPWPAYLINVVSWLGLMHYLPIVQYNMDKYTATQLIMVSACVGGLAAAILFSFGMMIIVVGYTLYENSNNTKRG